VRESKGEGKRNPCGRQKEIGFQAQKEEVKPTVEVTSRLKVLLPLAFWSHNRTHYVLFS